MKRLTSTLVLALFVGGVAGMLVETPVVQAKDAPLTLADWDKNYDKLLRDAVKDTLKLAEWCDKNGLQWTSTVVRRGVFRYEPDNEETRGWFGYEKQGARWVQNDLRRDDLRTNYIDDEDPNGKKFRQNEAKLTEAIAKDFYGAAVKADKEAVNPDQTESPSEWKKRSERAWTRVLALRPDTGEDAGLYKNTIKYQKAAHEALGHPKFNGEYVSPFKLKHLEVRVERDRTGKEYAGKMQSPDAYKLEEIPCGGVVTAAGLSGVGVRSEHVTVYSTHPQEVANRLARSTSAALEDAIAIYQFPDAVRDRFVLKVIDQLKYGENGAKTELKQVLSASGARDADRLLKADFSGTNLTASEYVSVMQDGPNVEDYGINVANKCAAETAAGVAGATVGRRLNSPEDWLWQSMSYDATQRINDTAILVWGSFGKYGQNVVRRPGQNVWIQLARRQVEIDDDVTIDQLYLMTLPNQDFKGREIVKGYAFLQFLMESDPAKGREFIWNALPLGTPAAAMKVYGADVLGEGNVPEIPAELPNSEKKGLLPPAFQTVLDELESRYRTWILETY